MFNHTDDAFLRSMVALMKAGVREKELEKLKNFKQTSIPRNLTYMSGELSEQYIHNMKIVRYHNPVSSGRNPS